MRFHTNLPVRDIDETVAFYTRLFDAAPVKTKKDYAKFLPPNLSLNISFHHDPTGLETLRAVHLGFELPDQAAVDAAYARLRDAGITPENRETSICCYADQDKFWVTDPNGYRWELYYLVKDTDLKISQTTSCCATEADGSRADAAACGCG